MRNQRRAFMGAIGRHVAALTAASAMLALPVLGHAESAAVFPAAGKPVTLIVPFPPGGPLDTVARVLAQAVQPTLGKVIVENRPGAGGNIGMTAVAQAAPDGYTIGMGALSTHAINPWLYPHMPFDPLKDFAPITLVANVPNVLVLNKEFATSNNIKSVKDLIDYLKQHPGKVNFGSGGNGSGGHLAGELFKQAAHVYMVHIPYRGAAPAQMALLGNDVQLMFDNLGSAAPRIRKGDVVALGVTTPQRATTYPELPTFAESGVPELKTFDISTWFGLFAPAGTPTAVVDKLNQEFTAALRSAPVRDKMLKFAAEPAPTTPAQFDALVRRENKRYKDIVKRSGAKID